MKKAARTITIEIRRFYNKVAAKYDRTIAKDLSDKEWLQQFADEIRKRGLILDVGCGPGNFAEFLIKRGLSVVGVDISDEMIAIARKNVPRAEFIQCDCRHMNFKESSFDGILAAYSLLHLPKADATGVIKLCEKFLKRGGVLALMMKDGAGEIRNKSKLSKGDTYYVCFWSMNELISLCNRLKLQTIAVDMGVPGSKLEIQRRKLFLLARKVGRSSP